MREFCFGNWQIVSAAECGGNLACVRWCGHDIMHGFSDISQWAKAPAIYGFPVLFPPNRIADGVFRFRNKTYRLPLNEPERSNHLHGIALSEKWQETHVSRNGFEIFWEFNKNSPAYINYPFDCKLVVSYTFSGNSFIQKLCVENNSALPMPCAAGFHSSFNAPERFLIHGTGKRIELLPPYYRASGREIDWTENAFSPNKWCSPPDLRQSGHFKMDETHSAELDHRDFQIRYTVDEKFNHWMVWKPEQENGFLCIEPMNIKVGTFENDPDSLPALEPGECMNFISRVEIIC